MLCCNQIITRRYGHRMAWAWYLFYFIAASNLRSGGIQRQEITRLRQQLRQLLQRLLVLLRKPIQLRAINIDDGNDLPTRQSPLHTSRSAKPRKKNIPVHPSQSAPQPHSYSPHHTQCVQETSPHHPPTACSASPPPSRRLPSQTQSSDTRPVPGTAPTAAASASTDS